MLALAAVAGAANLEVAFPRTLDSYGDAGLGVGAKLVGRIREEPFNLVATALFLAAIVHTFLAPRFMAIAHRYQHAFEALRRRRGPSRARRCPRAHAGPAPVPRAALSFPRRSRGGLRDLGRSRWAFAIVLFKGWPTMVHYVADTSFTEPVFVVVIMAIAASRPVLAPRRGVPRAGRRARRRQPGRLVAFHSHRWPAARFLHHRAGGDDDLRPAALPPLL